jgi:hypothetical protein
MTDESTLASWGGNSLVGGNTSLCIDPPLPILPSDFCLSNCAFTALRVAVSFAFSLDCLSNFAALTPPPPLPLPLPRPLPLPTRPLAVRELPPPLELMLVALGVVALGPVVDEEEDDDSEDDAVVVAVVLLSLEPFIGDFTGGFKVLFDGVDKISADDFFPLFSFTGSPFFFC